MSRFSVPVDLKVENTAHLEEDVKQMVREAFQEIQAKADKILKKHDLGSQFNLSIKAEIAEPGSNGGYGSTIGFWYSDDAPWIRFKLDK
jgi:Ca2+-binding EF-hand superfamily protein